MSTPFSPAIGIIQQAVPQFLRPVSFRLVQTASEFKDAMRLVYREYLKRGYVHPHPSELKLSIYNAFTTTKTFVGIHPRRGIIATISLVQDSPCGVPMDEIYKTELDGLRRRRLRLAEVLMLSTDSRMFEQRAFTLFNPKKLLLTLRLFKVLFDYVRTCTDLDEIVACFNPRHQSLYDLLHMQPLGRLKSYSSANGNPAIARHINVRETEKRVSTSPMAQFFYGKPPSPKRFGQPLTFSEQDFEEFFIRASSVFASASPSELAHVQACYPGYRWGRLLAQSACVHA